MCQTVVTPLTFCDISNSDFRWGVAGAALKFEVARVFSHLDSGIPGDDLRAERFNFEIVADKFARLSLVRKANGTTFFVEICSLFQPERGFYFGDASSSKKTKTFFTRMSSTCGCCRVSAGDAFADWDTAKQTSWTLRRRLPKLKFSCSVNKQKRNEAKNLSQLYHHHHNVVVMFYVFAVHKKNLCFLLLAEVTKRNSRVQLSCFLSAMSCNWHCGRPPSHKTPPCASSRLSCKL